jgi:N-acetylmuramoyl-L-alanine amidase-like protein
LDLARHERRLVASRLRRRLLAGAAALLASGWALVERPVAAQQAGAGPPITVPTPNMPPIVTPTVTPTPGKLASLPSFVRPREAWGAAPPALPYVPHTPRGVVLHHTGAPYYGQPAVEQYLRNIQAFHTGPEREWEDIAYHFLVDLQGGVWAGRPPEVRGNPSVYYESLGLVLICFIGDYTVQQPSDDQLNAASRTAAWLLRRYNLPLTALDTHRNHAQTNCPGDNVFNRMQDGTIGRLVTASLAAPSG